MPNHVHWILAVVGNLVYRGQSNVGAPLVGALCSGNRRHAQRAGTGNRAGTRPAPTLADVVRAFKSITTLEYVRGVKNEGWPPFAGKLWQRNYFERVIRNERELFETRKYIQENPLKWDSDPENPNRLEHAAA